MTPLQYCNREIDQQNLFRNAYFLDLQNGTLSQEQFQSSQEQFYFAVNFFSRPMSALISRLECAQQRASILANIVEEHGNFEVSQFHSCSFLAFLASIQAQADPSKLKISPAVQAFNSTLLSVCSFEQSAKAIACLGAIELAFAEISGIIGRAVIQNHWVHSIAQLQHYTTHRELDIEHAQDFFDLLNTEWDSTIQHPVIEEGIELGIFIFNRLYSDLRLISTHKIPHMVSV